MSQWGPDHSFEDAGTRIKVLAHVYTGPNPFERATPDSLIDLLTVVDIQGSREHAERMFKQLASQWVGKRLADWQDAAMPLPKTA